MFGSFPVFSAGLFLWQERGQCLLGSLSLGAFLLRGCLARRGPSFHSPFLRSCRCPLGCPGLSVLFLEAPSWEGVGRQRSSTTWDDWCLGRSGDTLPSPALPSFLPAPRSDLGAHTPGDGIIDRLLAGPEPWGCGEA